MATVAVFFPLPVAKEAFYNTPVGRWPYVGFLRLRQLASSKQRSTAMSRSVGVAMDAAGADADQARLHQLGYRQELKRGLSLVSNFAFSFSIISVLTGVTTTYGTGLRYGGPVSMTLGWLVVAAFNGCVALSMAEICSAYPTSGGLYYWSAKLAGKEWAPLASWVTGWFNIVGQWACTTSVDFSLAQLLQVIILLATGGANGGGYMASKYVVLAIYSAILILHGLINSLPIRWLSWFGQLGAFWNVAGAFSLTILIPAVAKERVSPEFTFTHFNAENGAGIHDKAYILAAGLLMSQYSLIGYDTSAHIIEETKNADWSGPIGIITSVALSTMFGWIYLIALTSIMTDIPYLLNPSNDAGGYAIAQALYTSFHRRYGTGTGALACLGVIAVAIFLCGSACITSNSRMGYAFSRDGAMPLSRVWHRVDSREVPLNVVWLSVAVAFVMALTLGYRQELKRGLSVVSNFAFSFSIISVLTGVTTTYGTGLRYGGPVSMTLGWLVVSAFNGCVALSMAEICSAYPTSGGLYYWSAKLAGKEWAPLASWWACTTSVDFSLAQLLQVIILLATGGANGGGYMASKYVVLAIYSAILILHGLINSLPIHWLSWFGQLGAFWNVAGVFALTILIPAVAKEKASPEFIFTHFNTENGMGVHQNAYILAVGLLVSQYSVIGYDTSAHMIEETKNADWSGPMGIITSVGLSTMFGWIYLVTLTSIVVDIPYLLSPDNDAGGYAIAQALYTSFHRRYGTGAGALACLGVIAVAVFLCGSACITSNSRMGYAFSRDGAMPLSRVWHRVDSREVPLNVVWLSVAVAFVMALTSLGSQVAFQAMVSVTTLGLTIQMALSRSVEVAVPADPAGDGDRDKIRLRQLGYKQELKRGLSVISNFAFSFSIISVMAGVTTTYSTGLRYGGPVSMTLGWLVVSAFNGCMALSMAEICSAYPTSGGLYYWSAKLAGNDWAPFACWITGWFNITGQWAATTSVDFALAQLVQVIVLLSTGGANGGGYMASNYVVLAIYGAMLVIHGAINSLPIQCLSWFGQLGAFWNAAGVFVLVALIPAVATERASVEFIFTHFNTENGMGIRDKAYILLIGLLMSQYAMAGYDTSAHMTEETKNADWSGPIGIVTSVALSTVFGWIYVVSLTSAVTDIPYLLSPDNDAGGNAVAQAFYTTFHRRYGSGLGGILCLGVVAVAVFLCGLACITSNSRMAYAFSRDGAMPFSKFWHRVNKQEVPINAVWLSVVVAFIMALTSLGSQVAFQAMVSIATIGLCISYALPIFFRVTTARGSFVPGPFHLGKCGIVVGWAAVLWVAAVTVLFSLPVAYPVAEETFNYTPVAVGGVLLLTVGAWALRARFWFQGPITNTDGGPL
uniref:Amino acid permease/ SLC12A domain-containing protein n=1 Tax=Oryza meridionalis TaxID=40149 RepID=A0A0E0CCV9_9ORYZ